MRASTLTLLVLLAPACRIDEHIAPPPPDGVIGVDAGGSDGADAAPCTPGTDGDGDGVDDCTERDDGDPFTDPAVYNGLHAVIGARPPWLQGSCDHLSDYAEMETRYATPVQEHDVRAGWEFDTDANSYDDPSYGFDPSWPMAQANEFTVRFAGRIQLAAGPHCFSVDIGATGTGIIDGKNACGQVYVGVGAAPMKALAETGYGAASVDARVGCVDVATAGAAQLDIVYWYSDANMRAKLQVRHCAGAACTPGEMITPAQLQVR